MKRKYNTCFIFRITSITNHISSFEQQANLGEITSEAKNDMIAIVLIPMVFMLLSFFIYKKKYKLDEDEYVSICGEIEKRKKAPIETSSNGCPINDSVYLILITAKSPLFKVPMKAGFFSFRISVKFSASTHPLSE